MMTITMSSKAFLIVPVFICHHQPTGYNLLLL